MNDDNYVSALYQAAMQYRQAVQTGEDEPGIDPEPTVESSAGVQAAKHETGVDPESTAESTDGPVHPYLEEIIKCPSNDWQLEWTPPDPFKPLQAIPYTFVDSKELFDGMMTKLREEKEIGLGTPVRDTFHSFHGISCLIELTTRSEAFLVDTIALKDEVKILNEVFTNSGVLKIMLTGGTKGDNDIENLQKDLGLYMVNMFSVVAAWRSLHFKNNKNWYMEKNNMYMKNFSLGHILKEYCAVDLDKFFKNFHLGGRHHRDWHIRPLTKEKVKYARIQVQYLFHLYDRFRNLLIEEDLLQDVYQRCNEFCKEVWYPGKHLSQPTRYLLLYKRMGKWTVTMEKLTKLQMEVFRVMYDWRDTTAEKHDTGVVQVLKDSAIYDIAWALPRTIEEMQNCLTPGTSTTWLEENYGEVFGLINTTIAAMAGAPDAQEKVAFTAWATDSGIGKKRKKKKVPPMDPNSAKKKITQELLEGKHPVQVLEYHCQKLHITPPRYTVITEQGNSRTWNCIVSVEVDDVTYQPTEPSRNQKLAKTWAAIFALKELGLASSDMDFSKFLKK